VVRGEKPSGEWMRGDGCGGDGGDSTSSGRRRRRRRRRRSILGYKLANVTSR